MRWCEAAQVVYWHRLRLRKRVTNAAIPKGNGESLQALTQVIWILLGVEGDVVTCEKQLSCL